ncbi:MAG: hypothetical protein M3063_05570 [Actinomycetota bacterium]|nr:hypothetical protein [Actinomycetota bacterium]
MPAATVSAGFAPAGVATAAPATPAPPTPAPPTPPVGMPAAQAYVLVDTTTGRILNASNDHVPLSPASLTKMLTALVATTYLPAATPIPISARAENVEPDKIGVKAGEQWPVDEVIQALLIISANDAAYALAERTAGTAENFDPVLQNAANQIGMVDNPVFNDPSGLDDTHGINGGNLVSARDLAISGRDLLSVPRLAQIVSAPALRFTGPNGTVYNLGSHNRTFLSTYPGGIGVKTGFTDKAGVCLAAAATRNGRTMLAVVLHGANADQSAKMLIDQGFSIPEATEPAADALPPVSLPEPEPAPRPTTTAPAPVPASGPAVPAVHHVAAASTNGGLLAGLNPGGDSVGSLWPAPVAAVILGLVTLLTARHLRARRRPLAHGRRR